MSWCSWKGGTLEIEFLLIINDLIPFNFSSFEVIGMKSPSHSISHLLGRIWQDTQTENTRSQRVECGTSYRHHVSGRCAAWTRAG